ncbi:hypothetical protein TA3x_002151 [Tundrisphaera sp. TA3]|uniref:hypothetical protein n=1 Tax=Tundrisphaera sp. TA3 TaxID=3435775 RepID=UPI003EB8D3ED
MRHWASFIALLVAITGTPLRQAEAASDLSRSLAGLFEPADVEPLDGAVGDDSGDGTLTASHGPQADAPPVAGLSFLPPPSSTVRTPAAEEGLWERAWWPQAPPRRRHAWLQVFRF